MMNQIVYLFTQLLFILMHSTLLFPNPHTSATSYMFYHHCKVWASRIFLFIEKSLRMCSHYMTKMF